MISNSSLALITLVAACLAWSAKPADSAPRKAAKKAAAAVEVVVLPSPEWSDWRAQYCEDWGPDGFGLMAGALPRYAWNAFPHWHGECRIWGPHYSASGTARW
jgi:hypothetical protein